MGERAKAHVLAGGMSALLSALVLAFAGLSIVGGFASGLDNPASGVDSVMLPATGSIPVALIREQGFGDAPVLADPSSSERRGQRAGPADGSRACSDCDQPGTDPLPAPGTQVSDPLVETGVSVLVGPISENVSVKAGQSSGGNSTTVEAAGVKVNVKTPKGDAVTDSADSVLMKSACLVAC